MTDTPNSGQADRDTTSSNVRAAIIIFLTATASFALFGSADIVSMSYDLPENAWTLPLVTAAERWHAAMEALGTAAMAQGIRDAIAGLRAIGWP